MQKFSSSDLDRFLIGWRNELRNELLNDPQGRLGRKYQTLAQGIPDNFPEPKALQLYCRPITSQVDLSFTPNYSDWLVPGIPSTKDLASLCDSFFGWGPDILKCMANHVWEGQFIQQLIKVFYFFFNGNRKLFITSIRSDLIRYLSELNLALLLAHLVCDTSQGPASKSRQSLASASTRFKSGCHQSQMRHFSLSNIAILPQQFMEVSLQ